MKIIYLLINLDDNIDRLSIAASQLQKQSIEFNRVSAFDGRKLIPDDHPLYNKERSLRYMGRSLVGGEIGCYMSHLQCAENFIASDADYAVVLEDDCKITNDFNSKIKEILEFLKNSKEPWLVMNIGNEKLKLSTKLTTITINSQSHELHRAHYFPMTTTGIIWNKDGAKKFIQASTEIFSPIDNFFRYWLTRNNQGLALKPPLTSTIGAVSVIDPSMQNKKRKNNGRTIFYGISKQGRLWTDKMIALNHKIFK